MPKKRAPLTVETLTGNEKKIYDIITYLGYVPKLEELKEALGGLHISNLCKHMARLREAGLITRKTRYERLEEVARNILARLEGVKESHWAILHIELEKVLNGSGT